jgi:hypothetical protein
VLIEKLFIIRSDVMNDVQAILQAWALCETSIAVLSKEPEIVADLVIARSLPQLPPGYIPAIIEVLFDDVPYVRAEHGVLTFVRPCAPDYHPPFVEYRFDGETALFHVGQEYVVNRIQGMAQATAMRGLLNWESADGIYN